MLIIFMVLFMIGFSVWILLRSHNKDIHIKKISVSDIADVYQQISIQGVETSFAVFIVTPPQRVAEENVEIQFSVEKGVTGLDWILMSESNRREKLRVNQYALDKGMEWQECEMNEWLYLRIEKGDLVELCTSLIRDLYAAENVILKYGGFKYH